MANTLTSLIPDVYAALADLEASGIRFQIVFLDASDDDLVKRLHRSTRTSQPACRS